MPTAEKVAEVEKLQREVAEARSVLLADFTGMDVAALSELRRRLRAEDVAFRVAKNTFSRRAFRGAGLEALEPLLEGPTGIAVGRGEELAAARVLVGFAREREVPRVKGGVIEGRFCTPAELKTLATLPARDALLGQLLMTVQAPATQVIGAVSRLMSDLMSIVGQVGERKAAG